MWELSMRPTKNPASPWPETPTAEMIMKSATALLITFAAALVLIHAEIYSVGLLRADAEAAASIWHSMTCPDAGC